jgi:hypothetical protein
MLGKTTKDEEDTKTRSQQAIRVHEWQQVLLDWLFDEEIAKK